MAVGAHLQDALKVPNAETVARAANASLGVLGGLSAKDR